jgi:dihydrofolate reductase
MSQVIIDVSMSVDGFTAGPNDSESVPLGEHGERLHEWMFRHDGQPAGDAPANPDAQIVAELFARVGAVLIGRRTFDIGLRNWGDVPFPVPCFVLTHRPHADLAMAGGTFTFITDGLGPAVQRARAAAGDRDVAVMGGDAGRQCLAAGLVGELHIHLVPVLLGQGVRLFEQPDGEPVGWEAPEVTQSPWVTHLRYRAASGGGRG